MDPYAAAALHVLRRHGGKRLIVASNTRTGVDRRPALYLGGVDELFDAVFQSSQMGGVAKPGAAFYRTVLDAAGCPPDQVLWVGDNLDKDVHGPARHGMRAVLVRRGGLAPGERLPAGTITISHISDLVPLLVPAASVRAGSGSNPASERKTEAPIGRAYSTSTADRPGGQGDTRLRARPHRRGERAGRPLPGAARFKQPQPRSSSTRNGTTCPPTS
ncbi:hypothetical protein C1I98_39015 [Spongiactinospora gelatinilytica]|uniref:HAD family hydrolase n=1 Tax=Spongiactinospora gelatinilytica TaxID=2666298 RepID=A0A2W2FMG1_9ACTN|nr:hypothetical protein C1I98_39015 [Spongiactinospora gelatinilytica]